MKIALASPVFPKSIKDGLLQAEKMVKDAALQQAEIICFPESYIPGYPLEDENVETSTSENMQTALDTACEIARNNSIAIILPMNWHTPSGVLNVAYVISNSGEILGYQPKVQLDPTEDHIWIPGEERYMFEVSGIKFGIVICHEGFRYPETVRWAAQRGAAIVFHPHCSGSNTKGVKLTEWGHKNNPYYEKAIMMRALENTIYFASVNYAMEYHESATALIGPDGTCIAHEAYGRDGILVEDINISLATGLLAKRLKNELHV